MWSFSIFFLFVCLSVSIAYYFWIQRPIQNWNTQNRLEYIFAVQCNTYSMDNVKKIVRYTYSYLKFKRRKKIKIWCESEWEDHKITLSKNPNWLNLKFVQSLVSAMFYYSDAFFPHILNVKLFSTLKLKESTQITQSIKKEENISTVTFPHVLLFFKKKILFFSAIQSITSVIHFIIIVWHFLDWAIKLLKKRLFLSLNFFFLKCLI